MPSFTPEKSGQEYEVGDLFVTETALTLKLMPSRKSGTVPIRWFAKEGGVTNVRRAIKATEGAGLSVAGVEVATDGTIRVLTGKPPAPTTEAADVVAWEVKHGLRAA